MKINSTQQEILLFTGTSFSCRQCFQKDGGSNHLTEKHAATIIKNLVKVGTKHRYNVLTSYANNFDLLNNMYEKIFWNLRCF